VGSCDVVERIKLCKKKNCELLGVRESMRFIPLKKKKDAGRINESEKEPMSRKKKNNTRE
jgi:hypothetical protein